LSLEHLAFSAEALVLNTLSVVGREPRGEIKLASAPGQDSLFSFRLTLPVAENVAAPERLSRAAGFDGCGPFIGRNAGTSGLNRPARLRPYFYGVAFSCTYNFKRR
jgi:hypothetical protein